jgi:hypothetical protein
MALLAGWIIASNTMGTFQPTGHRRSESLLDFLLPQTCDMHNCITGSYLQKEGNHEAHHPHITCIRPCHYPILQKVWGALWFDAYTHGVTLLLIASRAIYISSFASSSQL